MSASEAPKYQVRRADGVMEPGADYLVLRLDQGNAAALQAASHYAASIEKDLPSAASTLRDKVKRYRRGSMVDLGAEDSLGIIPRRSDSDIVG